MPATPPNDDEFADLFSRLPDPAQRTGRTAPEPAAPAPAAPAPTSRRAAREAAAQAADAPASAPTPVTPDAAEPTPAPAAPAAPEPAPATPAPVSAAQPVSASAAAASDDVVPASAEPQAPAASGVRRGTQSQTPQTIDALFGADDHSAERDRAVRHDRDRRKSRIAGWVVFGVIIAILGGLTAGGFYVWNTYEDKIRAFMGWEEPRDYEAGMATGEAVITIADGDIPATISQTLYDAGVTKTPTAFYRYLVDEGLNPTFYPGAYQLQQKMTSEAALAALEDPANKLENTAQLPEGLTVSQTLSRLADATTIPLEDFEAAVKDPSVYGITVDPAIAEAGGEPMEGWLFPATYTFDPEVTAQDIIQTLVDRTIASLDDAGVPEDQREEILTIASIIQREAGPGDFAKVSRVIQNRLDPSNDETFGKLQMDSTAQYGYGELHDGTVSSSQEALDDDNPWNTYVHEGLPIGPIANPGDEAIAAAMHPADGPWLYFVTVNLETGETIFSTTYAEHQKAVVQWQEWCAANPDSGC